MRVPLTVSAISPVFKAPPSRASTTAAYAKNVAIKVFERGADITKATPVDVFTAEEGGSVVAQPLLTDFAGRVSGPKGEDCWVEEAALDLAVTTTNAKGVTTTDVASWEPGRRTVQAADDVDAEGAEHGDELGFMVGDLVELKVRHSDRINLKTVYGMGSKPTIEDEMEAYREAHKKGHETDRDLLWAGGEYPADREFTDPAHRDRPIRHVGDGARVAQIVHKNPKQKIFKSEGSYSYLGVNEGAAHEWEKGPRLAAQATRGSTVMNVGDSAPFKGLEGRFFKLRKLDDPVVWLLNNKQQGLQWQRMQLKRIVSASQVEFYGAALHTFNAEQTSICLYNTVDGQYVRGIGCIADTEVLEEPSGQTGLYEFRHPLLLEIADSGSEDFPNTTFHIMHFIGGRSQGVVTLRGRDDLGPAAGAYAVKLSEGGQGWLHLVNQSLYGRHTITSGGGEHDGPPQLVKVLGGMGEEHGAATFDTHPGAKWWVFESLLVASASRTDAIADSQYVVGVQIRGEDCSVIDLVALGCDVAVGLIGAKNSVISGGRWERNRIGLLTYSIDGLEWDGTVVKDSRERHIYSTNRVAEGGTPQVKNLDVGPGVKLKGDPSIAPYEFQEWDDNNRFEARVSGHSKDGIGIRVPKLTISSSTITVPPNADTWRVVNPEGKAVSRFANRREQKDRTVHLIFKDATTFEGAAAEALSAPAVEAGTKLSLQTDGITWTELGRRKVPETLLLDAIGGAASVGAFSLRKLRRNYVGPGVKLRRSSDNAEKEFSFGTDGELPWTEILAWAGAGSAFLVTWYDQSLYAVNATQATTTKQPKVVDAGARVEVEGRPAIHPDGVNDLLTSAARGIAAAALSVGTTTAAIMAASTVGGLSVVGEGKAGEEKPRYIPLATGNSGTKLGSSIRNDANEVLVGSVGVSAAALDGKLHVVTVTDSPAYSTDEEGNLVYAKNTLSYQVDGGAAVTQDYTNAGTFALVDTFSIFARPQPDSWYPDYLTELVVMPLTANASDLATVQENQIDWAT